MIRPYPLLTPVLDRMLYLGKVDKKAAALRQKNGRLSYLSPIGRMLRPAKIGRCYIPELDLWQKRSSGNSGIPFRSVGAESVDFDTSHTRRYGRYL